VVNTLVGSTPVTFNWHASGRYFRSIDGVEVTAASGAAVSTPNVIVQFCSVTVHPGDVDVNGSPAMFTHSVGSGRAVLFRNGKRIEGRWSRPHAGSATVFADRQGKPLLLAPGGAYVVLAANGAPL
jgi:hypothetical protein